MQLQRPVAPTSVHMAGRSQAALLHAVPIQKHSRGRGYAAPPRHQVRSVPQGWPCVLSPGWPHKPQHRPRPIQLLPPNDTAPQTVHCDNPDAIQIVASLHCRAAPRQPTPVSPTESCCTPDNKQAPCLAQLRNGLPLAYLPTCYESMEPQQVNWGFNVGLGFCQIKFRYLAFDVLCATCPKRPSCA
jgi:hypothetical protein